MNDLREFDHLKAEVSVFVGPTMTLAVKDPAQCGVAISTVKEVKEYTKKIEERRKALVKPYNEIVDRINAYAKEIRAPLEAAETHIKSELLSWERVLEKQRQEEAAKAAAEQKRLADEASAKAAADREAAEAVAMFSQPAVAELQKAVVEAESAREAQELQKAYASKVADISANKVSGVRKTWTFRVTDLEKVPVEYLSVNEKAIRDSIRDGRREIPGIEIFQETSIAVR